MPHMPIPGGAAILESKSDAFENGLLLLIFNNVALALVGDASGIQPSDTAGALYVSLHSADPGEAGTQATSEIAYTSYARVGVARSPAGWTVTANSVTPTVDILFPAGTGGSGVATHFAIGAEATGPGKLLYSGEIVTDPVGGIVCGSGIAPRLTTATTITEG